jgi:hypothetical protein
MYYAALVDRKYHQLSKVRHFLHTQIDVKDQVVTSGGNQVLALPSNSK